MAKTILHIFFWDGIYNSTLTTIDHICREREQIPNTWAHRTYAEADPTADKIQDRLYDTPLPAISKLRPSCFSGPRHWTVSGFTTVDLLIPNIIHASMINPNLQSKSELYCFVFLSWKPWDRKGTLRTRSVNAAFWARAHTKHWFYFCK